MSADRRLHPDAMKLLDKDDLERIEYIHKDKWIEYPLAKNILAKMESKFNEPPSIRKQGMLLYGDSDNGKTALLKRFYRLHPPGEYDNGNGYTIEMMPVLYVLAPPSPDESRLYSNILSELFIPYKEKDSIQKKLSLVEYYLKHMNVKLLQIDEIHNILSGPFAKQRVFMNALKNLSNSLSITIVIAGTRDALSAVSVDSQIKSRFKPTELPRWEANADFASTIVTLETLLPLKKASDFAKNPKLLQQIYDISDGKIGGAIHIVKQAAIVAIQNKSEQITAKELSEGIR